MRSLSASLFVLTVALPAHAQGQPTTPAAPEAQQPSVPAASPDATPDPTPPTPDELPAAQPPVPPQNPAAAGPKVDATPPPPTPPPGRPPLPPRPDELDAPGYLPGYRRYEGLGLSPYAPRMGGLPGGVTPSFAAPMPSDDWSFTWSGYMSAALQISIDEREDPQSGQSKTVFHAPPVIVEEYASFTSTNSLPGNWIGSNFSYGNSLVTATVSIDTWNPTRPTNQYSIGSQYFINNMFLKFRAPPVEGFRLGFTVGFFSNNYGGLGRYGGGFYTNTMTGGPSGAGETTSVEYDLSDTLIAVVEHGIMGPRIGFVPMSVVAGAEGVGADPQWPAAFTHHVHLGLVQKGSDLQLQGQVHYMTTWAQDERVQRSAERGELPLDLPTTPEIDESYIRDGRIRVLGFDARAISRAYGVLGVGGAYIDGYHAYPLKGITTFGGDGERLTSSWWGPTTSGTGTMLAAGVSYSMSVASLMLYPEPFNGNAPDVTIDTGIQLAYTKSDEETFDDRLRHKYGVNVLYTFLPYMAAGIRVDRVVPSSKNSRQTFHVVAPRLQFKTNWTSHEAISVTYVKWFLGEETHLDGTQPRTSERIDDQMFTLNFNMWW